MRHRSSGYTLIQILVVGIVGVLASLLVVAISRTSDSARRTQCLNNLHQIGVALHAFEASHQDFPDGPEVKIALLPYLGEEALAAMADELGLERFNNTTLRHAVPKVYVCPNDPGHDFGPAGSMPSRYAANFS